MGSQLRVLTDLRQGNKPGTQWIERLVGRTAGIDVSEKSVAPVRIRTQDRPARSLVTTTL